MTQPEESTAVTITGRGMCPTCSTGWKNGCNRPLKKLHLLRCARSLAPMYCSSTPPLIDFSRAPRNCKLFDRSEKDSSKGSSNTETQTSESDVVFIYHAKGKLMATNSTKTNWHREVDVVVVGFGAAGGISAITAHDAGAKVLLIEKMPHPGGISILNTFADRK